MKVLDFSEIDHLRGHFFYKYVFRYVGPKSSKSTRLLKYLEDTVIHLANISWTNTPHCDWDDLKLPLTLTKPDRFLLDYRSLASASLSLYFRKLSVSLPPWYLNLLLASYQFQPRNVLRTWQSSFWHKIIKKDSFPSFSLCRWVGT